MTLCWVREYEDVRLRHGCSITRLNKRFREELQSVAGVGGILGLEVLNRLELVGTKWIGGI